MGLNVDGLIDGIGNLFSAFNQTTSLAGNAVAAANTAENQGNLGSIITLLILGVALAAVIGVFRGKSIVREVRKYMS